jgi:hypothetical protein
MKRILAVLLGLAVSAAGCSDPVAPATPTPAPPTITETFTGQLLVLGSNSHTFTVQQIGGLQVTVNGLTPPAAVGVAVGTPSGATCLAIQSLTAVANPTAQISGTATITGSFCVRVYDVGNLVEPVNYTVTVLHS